jgi:hypothetical protein
VCILRATSKNTRSPSPRLLTDSRPPPPRQSRSHMTFVALSLPAAPLPVYSSFFVSVRTIKRHHHQVSLKKKCCLLVLNSVTSPPRWIRQPHGAWLCVFFSFFWRSRILRMSPPLSFPAPQLSHFALCHPDLLQTPPQPSQSPPRFHLCPSSPFGHVRFTSPLHPGFYYTHLM